MKIRQATFLGVRGVADGTYGFAAKNGVPHDIVVVTGPAASGKTRLLEALFAAKEAIGPYGALGPGKTWLRPGESVAKVMLTLVLEPEECEFAGVADAVVEGEAAFLADGVQRDADEGLAALLSRYRHQRSVGKVEYFPASRRLSPLGPHHGTSELEQRVQRASKDPTKYGFVNRLVRELAERPDASEEFAALLARLSPTVRHVPGFAGLGLPRAFSSRGGDAVTASELSDTEQQCVLLAAVAVGVGLSSSLVLIDRPELASATGGTALVEALRTLGQRNQLLLASNAPDIVAAVPSECVVELEPEG